jgi:TrmH family RNA methyltransferase
LIKIQSYTVILIEPKHPGNIGAVARIMKNFNVTSLFLVNPCKITDESYIRAVHADDILDSAQIFSTFEQATKTIDFLAATSSKETLSEKKHLRNPLYLDEFSDRIQDAEGSIGLVFGREDFGLLNEEIACCDVIVRIPTDPGYKALNLSHSVGIFLYSLYIARTELPGKRTPIDGQEKNHLYQAFSDLLYAIDYPDHKKEKTEVMFKRMISRSIPSKWEYHTLMGVIRTAVKHLDQKKE